MTEQILSAWVYDPTNNIFGDKGGRAARYRITCQSPQGCDIYTKQGSCLLTGIGGCKFGRKTSIQGPTKRAQNFRKWMLDQEVENAEHIGKLSPLKAWGRIAYINGFYYLPYSHMEGGLFLRGKPPLESKWVSEADMTSGLLAKVCSYVPWGLGGPIPSYQKEIVPKFIADLHMFYPALFSLLPDDQKARIEVVSYVGRTAELKTCNAGEYTFGKDKWHWDGEKLTGNQMLFQPVNGECVITITPKEGASVKITDPSQVGPQTVMLD
jgi:hypothetical protein